ncbi:putative alkylsulfatase [Mycolicibacterium hassiacum DSM 44199]|uniref:Putative alkylsulfatase n=1 Tax=Mycolicibacterium hassiacum (strain DSM 44199 / CIP 105218 / JCM 12690 / 3849) TaxID=1122247 RepID=K5BEN9_MYCHD|nr:TauD/TfdA family dioxygenase [Mycolicibacterium hassiacum]EKF23167.1 putative alkylsulfatase [Mycolicibacterium hassiacum DSM 44199]MDA4085596.1 taurine dioxygenase [Mycolicibacterium hassiacum DSM 44199]VCT89620.1 Alpha-ketoglutarate-dependent sulfate ester dioxygenase [Mycolicibacterium hassiacum DSM 44199]
MTELADTTVGLDVRPVAGHIGAEIRGVDLAEPLEPAVVEEIRTALYRYKVLFFRDQRIGHAEQVAFARRFGRVTPAHPHEEDPPAGFPEILPIDSRRYERQLGRKRTSYDHSWHTDVTALVNPPAASILRAEVLPPYGGDTAWTNLVAAYEHLPEPLRDFADRLDILHRFAPRAAPGSQRDRKVREANLAAWHPAVRVHPVTGERALFVSPGFTRGPREIRGFNPEQSERILRLLWEEATRPEYTVRFRWEPGSVAFWDNRATAHLAIADAAHLGHDRVLYRVTLEGDIPRGVDGRQSELVSGAPFHGA